MNGFYIYIQWTYNLLKCQTAGSEKNSYWLWFYPTLSGLIGKDFHMLIHMTLCQDNRTMYRASNWRFFWYIVSTGIFIFSQSWSWHMCCFNSCDVSKLWGLGATVNVPMLMWINKINTVPLGAVLMCFLCTLYWCIMLHSWFFFEENTGIIAPYMLKQRRSLHACLKFFSLKKPYTRSWVGEMRDNGGIISAGPDSRRVPPPPHTCTLYLYMYRLNRLLNQPLI